WDRVALGVEPHPIAEHEALGFVSRLDERRLSADVELPAGLPLSVVGNAAERGVVDRKPVALRVSSPSFSISAPQHLRAAHSAQELRLSVPPAPNEPWEDEP